MTTLIIVAIVAAWLAVILATPIDLHERGGMMKRDKHFDSDKRFAELVGLDPDELHAATTAAWSNLNPQSIPRERAQNIAAVVLLAIGRDQVVQRRLGHKSASTTLDIYAHLDDDR